MVDAALHVTSGVAPNATKRKDALHLSPKSGNFLEMSQKLLAGYAIKRIRRKVSGHVA